MLRACTEILRMGMFGTGAGRGWAGVRVCVHACAHACVHASMCMYVCSVLREHGCVHASMCTGMHVCVRVCVYTACICVFTGTLPVRVPCMHDVCARVCTASGMCVSMCMRVWLVYICVRACVQCIGHLCASCLCTRVHVSMCRCALVECTCCVCVCV